MASSRQAVGTQVVAPVPTVPNGYAAGDLLLAFVYVGYSSGFSDSSVIDTPTGWTLLSQGEIAHDTVPSEDGGDRVAVFYRLSTGTEPSTYTFTWGGQAGFVARIVVYRNVDQGEPVTSSGWIVTTGNDPNPVSLDIPFTTTGAARVVLAWAALADDISFAPPSPTEYLFRTQVLDAPTFIIIPDSGITPTDNIQATLNVADLSVGDATVSSRSASINTTSQEEDGERFVWGIAVVVNPAT